MSATLFELKKLITVLVMPPMGPVLLVVAGLLLARRRHRPGQILVWSGIAILLALSLPATATLLTRAVATEPGSVLADPGGAQAIVILGGGRRIAPEYGEETVSAATLERIAYGATLARRFNLPVLVTGGAPGSEPTSEAELMALALEQSFDVSVRWKEDRSRDTHENAVYSARILQDAGIDSILLVTNATHQHRSIVEFRAAGLEVVPAPVASFRPPKSKLIATYFPNASALERSAEALHEILGSVVSAL